MTLHMTNDTQWLFLATKYRQRRLLALIFIPGKQMQTLCVSGDSWTSNWPLEERGKKHLGWPALVAKHFDITLIDKSRAGSSNYRIYRKAVEGILDSNIDTVLVFLSRWERWETGSGYGKKPGRIYQHLAGEADIEVFKTFFNGYKQYTDSLRTIISLQSMAKQYNTRCYFLDTFQDNVYNKQVITIEDFKKIVATNVVEFDNMDDQRIINKFNKVINLYKHINKEMFISLTSYQEIIKDCKLEQSHPVEDGHRKIAQVVINFLEGEDSGKTI